MKKLIAFVVILAAAGGGWWYYIKYGKPPEKPTVNYAAVSRGAIVEAVTSTGTLEPLRRFDVGSQVSGTVRAIYADFNSIVKKGDLLAEIDPQLLQVQVDVQAANVERQRSDIANQEVQLEDQKKQFERTKSLYEKGLQNQQQYEAAELAIKTREAQIASAKKGLVQAEANLSSAKLNVSYTKIIAPNDGVVVERRVDVGQTVQASMTTPQFFVLATPLENLKLTALVDEAEIGRIRPGMEVRFTVDAYGRQEFLGSVNAVRLNASVQNNVVTYPVWIDVPNQDLKLRPSMTASLRIVISTADDVIRVPNQALRFRPNTEIYTALGLPPPAPGSGGRAAGAGGNEDNGRGTAGAPGARPGGQGAGAQQGGRAVQPGRQPGGGGGTAPSVQNRQGGQGGGQSGRSGGQGGDRASGGGFGGRSDLANMTPEQRQRLMERIAQGGGRGGGGRGGGGRTGGTQFQGRTGGRGAGQGARGAQAPAPAAPQREADKIDELWAPVVRTTSRSQVYTWDEAKKELKMIPVTLGVTDGTFSELISGEVKVGDQLVTGVVLPLSARPGTQGNPLFGNQPGMRPPGGGFDRGGGGSPGGGAGGGGRGGGGGGGGRGGE